MRGAAFLIGNSRYRLLPPLATPLSDIDVLSDRLEDLDFETYVVPDANFTMMNLLIAQFRERVRAMPPNTSVVFYFAGHGVQSNGENFLLPVETQPPPDGEWHFSAIELSAVLAALCWRPDQQKLIAIDACRTNGIGGFVRNAGLGLAGVSTERYSKMHETMILFAARPGQVAQDGGALGSSPFCRAMLGALEQPHRPLNALAPDITLRVEEYTGGHQEPWNTNNMKRMHAVPFVGREPPAGPPPPVVKGPRPSDEEIRSLRYLIHKIKSKDSTGRMAYYFVLVMPDMEARFSTSLKGGGSEDLEDYGWVIASNYGEEPSEEVIAYLREKYGFDIKQDQAAKAVSAAHPIVNVPPTSVKTMPALPPRRDEVRSLGHLVHMLKAKDTTGRWAYYFVLVRPDMEAQFLKSIDGDGTINIEDYGWVIASNYGDTPSEEIRAYLKEEYGFDIPKKNQAATPFVARSMVNVPSTPPKKYDLVRWALRFGIHLLK